MTPMVSMGRVTGTRETRAHQSACIDAGAQPMSSQVLSLNCWAHLRPRWKNKPLVKHALGKQRPILVPHVIARHSQALLTGAHPSHIFTGS